MPEKYLLCTDLDRTLLPNGPQPESADARKLFAHLVSQPGVSLAYVSGRSLALVREAITAWQLPKPDYILGDVGTSIYTDSASDPDTRENRQKSAISSCHDSWERWQEWDQEIGPDWKGRSGSDIAALLDQIDELKLQELHKQSTYKTSYYVDLRVDKNTLLTRMRTAMEQAGIRASLIWSIDESAGVGLLDVLPASATKKHAIEFLMQQQKFELANTVFAGDSGNDLPVLVSPVHSVLVANASEEVKQEALTAATASQQSKALYVASGGLFGMNGNYSAGIIEGFVHYIPQAEQWLQEYNG